MSRWQASGLTASEFASRHGLRATTLAWWKWRLGQAGSEPRRNPPRRGREAKDALPVIELRPAAIADERFEIAVGSARVRVPRSFDAEALSRLLAVLEGPR